jgi:hypothetical protein
VVLKLESVCIF